MTSVFRMCLLASSTIFVSAGYWLSADEPKENRSDKQAEQSEAPGSDGNEGTFQLSKDVQEVLSPLFVAIRDAKVSRATIELLSDSLMTGKIVESKKSTYQIASKPPNRFTVYLKEPAQRTRIYNDGETIIVALAPDAFFRLTDPVSNQEAMLGLPIPLGPYPEPILALTLAGVDPAISLSSGMKSIEIVDQKKFRGKIPAVHLHGVQADAVSWDLWLSQDDLPVPLRLLVDLTPMLLSSSELDLPKGYSHQLRFDFLSWRITGEVDDSLFSFNPGKDAREYESVEDYHKAVALARDLPPLLGKTMPEFQSLTLDGDEVQSKDLKDKVVVIDFWISGHPPCAEILPSIKKVCDEFAGKDVVFLAINVREDEKQIRSFLEKQKLKIPVVMDRNGSVTESFKVKGLPQTVVIGKNGNVESVHLGFPGKEALMERLTDELEVLSVGGQIATASVQAEETQESE